MSSKGMRCVFLLIYSVVQALYHLLAVSTLEDEQIVQTGEQIVWFANETNKFLTNKLSDIWPMWKDNFSQVICP